MFVKKETAIKASGLVKGFDGVRAVAGVDFEVFKGEFFGFLGPNGAGKTTVINMLTGLARPDEGNIIIGGINCTRGAGAAQHLIGVVPDESNLYPEMTGFENLCFCAALYGLKKDERQERAKKLLEEFGLAQAGKRKFGGYSKGMKRKLTIAAGIIHTPDILFLDEPTTGIDVAGARQLREIISRLHGSGTTIFLTTHYIEEAERLCDRIAFIVSGKIVKIETVQQLLEPVQDKKILELSCEGLADAIEDNLSAAFPEFKFFVSGKGSIRLESRDPVNLAPLIRFLEDHGILVREARRIRPSLEDVFVNLTGIEADTMKKEKGKGGKQQ